MHDGLHGSVTESPFAPTTLSTVPTQGSGSCVSGRELQESSTYPSIPADSMPYCPLKLHFHLELLAAANRMEEEEEQDSVFHDGRGNGTSAGVSAGFARKSRTDPTTLGRLREKGNRHE